MFSALAATLTVTVLIIYFLVNLPRLRSSSTALFPRAHRARFSRVAEVMVNKVGSYMLGNILVSLVAGLAAFAALTALRVPFAVPLAFVVAVTDLIPMIGATLGAVVCIAVALLATRLWPTTVLVAAFFVAYQQLENYLIAPRIMRGQVQLSPAAVLLASLIGGTALDLVGALMAIPDHGRAQGPAERAPGGPRRGRHRRGQHWRRGARQCGACLASQRAQPSFSARAALPTRHSSPQRSSHASR